MNAAEDVKSRINIVDLIGEYIRLNKSGINWKGLCPFHREKTPSFMVQEEKQIWHCFGCGKGGDVFSFLEEIESVDFKEALKILAEKAGVDLSQYSFSQSSNKSRSLEILELATKFFEKQLWEGAGKEKILDYLRKRGLKDETIKEFRLGYAPNVWRSLQEFLMPRGYSANEILKSGLLVENKGSQYDRFRDRITFPVRDTIGKVVGFSARVAPGGDETQAKYVNTPETDVYSKSKILFGIDKAKAEIKDKNYVLIVEGNMDMIASYQAGIKNVVAVSGTALTNEQLETLKRYTENVKLLFDMDKAGEAATQKSAQAAFQKDLNVSIVSLEKGKDAAEMVEKNPSEFLKSVEKAIPAMEYFIQKTVGQFDKKKVQDKKKIAKIIISMIRNFQSEIDQTFWIKKLADEIEVDEKILLDLAGKEKKSERNSFAEEKAEEKNEITLRKRANIIAEKILGLILADRDCWRRALEENEKLSIINNKLISFVIERGKSANFDLGNLISTIEREDVRNYLQKIYFETKYRFDQENEFRENEIEDAYFSLNQLLAEFKKEIAKEKMQSILLDIQKAEQNGDKEGKSLLIQEFSKLSKELQ
jgi:DNA primase